MGNKDPQKKSYLDGGRKRYQSNNNAMDPLCAWAQSVLQEDRSNIVENDSIQKPSEKRSKSPVIREHTKIAKEVPISYTQLEILNNTFYEEDFQNHKLLSKWEACALYGSETLSSSFYLTGILAYIAGKYAPFCLILTSVISYCLFCVYYDAISAHPMNGGSYSILLKFTNMTVALMSFILLGLSYLAITAFASLTAVKYIAHLTPHHSEWNEEYLITLSCILLFVIAITSWLLSIEKISKALLAISITNGITLVIICFASLIYMITNRFQTLTHNMQYPPIDVDIGGKILPGSLLTSVFFGFSRSMIGMSLGYESCAQTCSMWKQEKQGMSLLKKIMKNIMIVSCFLNPLLSILVLGVIPLSKLMETPELVMIELFNCITDGLFTYQTNFIKIFLRIWITSNGFLALSGTALSLQIGLQSLILQCALNRSLPQFLLNSSSLSKSKKSTGNPYICLFVMVLGITQILILNGNTQALVSVYNISFLAAVCLFVYGCILYAGNIPLVEDQEDITNIPITYILALMMASAGIIGNLLGSPQRIGTMVNFFMFYGSIISIVLHRKQVLRGFLRVLYWCLGKDKSCLYNLSLKIKESPCIIFAKSEDLYILNTAVSYIRENEQTRIIYILYCRGEELSKFTHANLIKNTAILDQIYPFVKIELIIREEIFNNNEFIKEISRELSISQNMMFITVSEQDFKMKTFPNKMVRIITY